MSPCHKVDAEAPSRESHGSELTCSYDCNRQKPYANIEYICLQSSKLSRLDATSPAPETPERAHLLETPVP